MDAFKVSKDTLKASIKKASLKSALKTALYGV